MSVLSAVGYSLLIAFGLPLAIFLFAYPLGRLVSLWQMVPLQERAQHQLFTSGRSVVFQGRFRKLLVGIAILQTFRKPVLAFLTQHGIIPPLDEASFDAAHLVLAGLFGSLGLVYPLIWSWRVLRLPRGACSAPLRRVASAALPLSILALGLVGWLALQLAAQP